MTKAALRKQLKNARSTLGPARRAVYSRVIVAHLRALPELQQAQRVGLFWPLPGEVDLRPLLDHAGPRAWALPVVTSRSAPLTFRDASGPLRPGPFGVRAPLDSAPEVPLGTIDLLLMPALGVTAAGARIGYGGGFYDRTLAEAPHVERLAVVFHCQVLESLPVEPHDLPLHGFISERGVHRV